MCDTRFRSLRDREAWRNLDLWQVIREGKAGMVAANLALSAYQRRLAEQFGIEPGAEMKTAADLADQHGTPVWIIDREISVTLKRAYRSVKFMDRMAIVSGLIASLFERGNVSEEEIEKLKEGDILQSAFSEFAAQSEPLYRSLIAERDTFMAARLREEAANKPVKRVLAVLGAGHLAGIERELTAQQTEPPAVLADLKTTAAAVELAEMDRARHSRRHRRGDRLLVHARRAVRRRGDCATGFLFTGCFAALGAALGGGHILSISPRSSSRR